MNDKRNTILAWVLCAVCVVGAAATFVVWLSRVTARPSLFEAVEALGWALAIPLVFSVLAAMIIARQPGNRVGWLMMIIALATVNPVPTINEYLITPPAVINPGLWLLLWLDNWSWIPVIFSVFLIPLHFPTGRPPSPRWNWVNRLAIGMWLFFIVVGSFIESIGPLNADWVLPNPIGFIPTEMAVGPVLIVWGVGLLTVMSASVVSLFVRYRRAQVAERQQIKWLLYAGSIFIVFYTLVYFLSNAGEFGSVSGWINLVFVLSILAFPIAIAIAIFRYRLYDIDVIIRKTISYTVVTGLLALIYFGSIVLLQAAFEALSGQQSPVSIVISTLLIAALFNPLRHRVQAFIDRRFYRSRYDAERALNLFAITTRDEVDIQRLVGALLHVVQETMQPETTMVWLRNERQ